MEVLANENRVLHVLRLRRNESKLAKFTARLDSIAELFTVITMSLPLTSDLILFSDLDRHHGSPNHVAHPHRGYCADRLIRGGAFQRPSGTLMSHKFSTSPYQQMLLGNEVKFLRNENKSLRNEVKFLQITAVFLG
jgi:hypothetical protein